MRISAKGRYALAAMICLGQEYGGGACTTVLSISEKLGISKIYLEQVFSLLRRGGIVSSVKGAQGGYQLARQPGRITLRDILSSVELALFEKNEGTAGGGAPGIEAAVGSALNTVEAALSDSMARVTLRDMVDEANRYGTEDGLMFYI